MLYSTEQKRGSDLEKEIWKRTWEIQGKSEGVRKRKCYTKK